MQDLAWPALMRDKEMLPFDIAPQIEQQERDGHQEQAQRGGARGSARADLIHQAIAALNAEAPPILFGHLWRLNHGNLFEPGTQRLAEVGHLLKLTDAALMNPLPHLLRRPERANTCTFSPHPPVGVIGQAAVETRLREFSTST